MVTLGDLWLPILLAAVFVFVVSSVVHMALPLHKGDFGKLPDEAGVLAAMRDRGVRPGDYMFPCPGSMKDMQTPEMMEKYRQGPVGFLTVMPSGAPAMGRSLVQWFLFALVVSLLVAYASRLSLDRGAGFVLVFRVTTIVAMLAYAVSHVPDSIWKGVRWSTTWKFVFDGVLYGLATGLAFGLLWPAAG